MGFVAATADEYGTTAALLLQMTKDAGLHVREVRTVRGGFEVPDVVSSQLVEPSVPAVPAVTSSATSSATGPTKTPPPGWDDPLPPVDVEFKPDGRVVLTEAKQAEIAAEPDREEIRAWAKEHGHKVADKGRLPNRVIEAYNAEL